MTPDPGAGLAAALAATHALWGLLHQVQGTIRLVAPIPFVTQPKRWRPRGHARLLCDLFLTHVHLEGMLDAWEAAIDPVRPRLRDVRHLTLQVGRRHHRCAADGLLAVAASLRGELRGRFAPLASGLVPAARAAGDVQTLARAVDMAFRLGRGTGQLEETLRQDLGPRGLEVFDGLRRSADFQAAAVHAVSGTLVKRCARLLDFDLGWLREELELEFCRAGQEGGTGQPDRKPDKSKKNKPPNMPKNQRVSALIRRLNRDRKKGSSAAEIARDFADGDAAEAESLLRQVRRFRHLLDE
jgi:hypothetical protein